MIDDAKVVQPPPPPRGRSARSSSRGGRGGKTMPKMSPALSVIPLFLLGLIIAGTGWWWYWWRIEPGNGEIAVLTRKTGKNLPIDEIIAVSDDYKGIQLDVLPEGRFFRNPYIWSWDIIRMTDIPAGKFGVLVRKFGKDLSGGSIIAPDENHKGIVREVLGTGKHRLNPFAYEVKLFDDIKIAPGYVGVVTSLSGADILTSTDPPSTDDKGFLAGEGWKGVRQKVLKEGTHRLNPYLYAVSIVNIQSQRFEFSGDEAIMFLTLDGFNVTVEGTLEFNVNVDRAAQLTHEVGDMEDIMKKLILPSARGFFRIEGSKKEATEFIVGESRQEFQNDLQTFLTSVCASWGISLNSVLIRDIIVPQQIASVIRDRELARQEVKKFEQQIVQAKSKAELEKQNALAEQKKEMVNAETEKIRMLVKAQQEKVEKTVAAKTLLDVAKVHLEAARADAESLLTLAEADRKVVEKKNEADADVLKQQVGVYDNENDFVRARLYEKIAPNIQSILATDNNGDVLGLPVKVYPETASRPGAVLPGEATPRNGNVTPSTDPGTEPPSVLSARKGGAE
ncbi:MAG: SPFH domain-containing protein [Kiritimatiellia bacterium]